MVSGGCRVLELYERDAARRLQQIWPLNREAWFGQFVGRFSDNLDWPKAIWGNRCFLEPLLDSGVPLGPMARLMLAMGLAAKEPGESSLATDALIAAIEEGRFDADRFGETVRFVLPLLKAPRLALTLSQAARTSVLHRYVLNRAVQCVLQGELQLTPRDLGALLEWLEESLVEAGEQVSIPETRAFLQSGLSGKPAQVARRLLKLEAKPDSARERAILLTALRGRLERAESCQRIASS